MAGPAPFSTRTSVTAPWAETQTRTIAKRVTPLRSSAGGSFTRYCSSLGSMSRSPLPSWGVSMRGPVFWTGAPTTPPTTPPWTPPLTPPSTPLPSSCFSGLGCSFGRSCGCTSASTLGVGFTLGFVLAPLWDAGGGGGGGGAPAKVTDTCGSGSSSTCQNDQAIPTSNAAAWTASDTVSVIRRRRVGPAAAVPRA